MKHWTEAVYQLVAKIPAGKVATYGQIAQALDLGTPRMVGWALHRNPDASTIPCHRVVNAQGRLAPNFAFDGWREQARRLEAEGVECVLKDGEGKVKNLRKSIWEVSTH